MLICGSLRSGSTNEALLRTVVSLLPADVAGDQYDGLARLPHFNPYEDHDPLPPSVVDLRGRIADADAILFSTPEYAGAMPGTLKNLLDWTVGGIETVDKPVAWINISTTGGATKTHDSLTTVLAHQPGHFSGVPQRRADRRFVTVPVQMHRGHQSIRFDRHPRLAFDDPGVDDVLGGIAFHLTQQRGHRNRTAGDDRFDVRVDEIGELVAIVASKGSNLRHDTASRKRCVRIGGRYQCGTTQILVG